MNICLIVITTFEENFLIQNEIRREQSKQYGIPMLFVYNGDIPEGFEFKNDELYIQLNGSQSWNPIMFIKFVYAVKEFYIRYGREPTFFVRCNAQCFIDFKKLPIVLRSLPTSKCIAGPFDSKYDDRVFCNGTCMIISNDVAKKLTEEEVFGNMMTLIENDDVTISWLGLKHGVLFDMTYWFAYYESLEKPPERLKEVPSKTVFYRIKNPVDRMKIDVGIWKMLHAQID
jgi:hypothetical protein